MLRFIASAWERTGGLQGLRQVSCSLNSLKGLYRGLYRGYIGIMEKKMETTV